MCAILRGLRARKEANYVFPKSACEGLSQPSPFGSCLLHPFSLPTRPIPPSSLDQTKVLEPLAPFWCVMITSYINSTIHA
jgi:hypothetical protein